MTSVRFAGVLPWWLGLLLAVAAAALAWRYYHRESDSLTGALRWGLPWLRFLSVFLVVMILVGPVLHHRQVIGQLGRVLVYLDGSQSMGVTDKHMSAARKVLIARQLGWLPSVPVDTHIWDLAEQLASLRQETNKMLRVTGEGAGDWVSIRDTFVKRLGPIVQQWRSLEGDWQLDESRFDEGGAAADVGSKVVSEAATARDARERLAGEVLARARAIDTSPDAGQSDSVNGATSGRRAMLQLSDGLKAYESLLRREFERRLQRQSDSDSALRSALTRFDALPRWRRVEAELLDEQRGVLPALSETHDVQVFTLQEDNVDAKWDASTGARQPDELLASAEGRWTNLAVGVGADSQRHIHPASSGKHDQAPQRTTVVLISDGQHNSGPSPMAAAQVLGQQGVPVYAVGMGSRHEPPDLAILDLQYPDTVFQQDDVRGEIILRDAIPAERPFAIEIRHGDEVLWRKELVTQDSPRRRVEFSFAVTDLVERIKSQLDPHVRQHAVPLKLEASITPLKEEADADNNSAIMRLAAITDTYHILLIDGRARWETRYLRNAFQRDKQWSLDVLIVGPGTDHESLSRGDAKGMFPADRERLYDYDLIVLGEVSPDIWLTHELTWIRQFVEQRGGGLLLIDGQRQLLRSYDDEDFLSLVPIRWRDEAVLEQPRRLELTSRSAQESAFRLAVDARENRRLWSELPPPHQWSCVEALPGAEVLLNVQVGEQSFPAMVLRSFGAGKVFYSAIDETWRWRYKAADTFHQRFWIQLATAMMAKPFAVSDEYASLDAGAARYPHGAAANIRVRLLGLDGRPANNATVDALLWKDGQLLSTVQLDRDLLTPGIYRGRTSGLDDGHYEVTLQASGYSRDVLRAKAEFVVEPPDAGEMREIACNETLLRDVAADSGGKYLREEQMGQLVTLLKPLSNGHVVESDTLLWQSYWWFCAILGLLATEWILRKRAGLL